MSSAKLQEFLCIDSIKTELFQFLASAIESAVTPEGEVLDTTKGESVVSIDTLAVSDLHEEADHHYASLRSSRPTRSEDHGPCHRHGRACTCTYHFHCHNARGV